MLLWASKFASDKMECSFEMASKQLWGNSYFAGMVHDKIMIKAVT